MILISNLINNIKNGIKNKLIFINCSLSKENIEILKILQKESIITGFLIGKQKIKIYINLKISNLFLYKISKSSNKVFSSINKIKISNQGAGITLISTSKGIKTDYDARISKLGGEIICQINWN